MSKLALLRKSLFIAQSKPISFRAEAIACSSSHPRISIALFLEPGQQHDNPDSNLIAKALAPRFPPSGTSAG